MQPELNYKEALKLGQKEVKAKTAKNESPYLAVLDEIIPPEKALSGVSLGVIQIPMWFIVGTKTAGRVNSFASNFMPILAESTEFAAKWESLFRSHMTEGIRESVKVYEYLNRYYVEEGNKRVSVMKYCGAYSIPADVIRIMPEKTDDEEIKRYYEYLEFNRYSKINFIEFSNAGDYKDFLRAMGKPFDEYWSIDEQQRFSSAYYYFEKAYNANGGDKLKTTVGDAMLSYIRVYGYSQLQNESEAQISINLKKMWEEIALKEEEDTIELKTAPLEEKKQSVLSKVLPIAKPQKLKAAFIYDVPPEKSGWVSDHEMGRRHAQTVMGDKVDTVVYICDKEKDYAVVLERAVEDNCKLIFTTSPRMLQASLRAAVEHPDIVVMNCSLNTSHRYVRTYYTRMYEVKFILGVLAGSLTQSGRLGYVCDYPIYGQIAGINAFALGAQMANPRAKVFLEWSSVKGAKEAAASLLASTEGAMFCLILVSVWQYAGYMMLIYVAGFMSVSKDVEEASRIDGCTSAQAMKNVTIPLMRSSFVQCIFLSITRCFVVYDVNLSLTNGEPYNSSVMAAMHVYNQAFTYKNYGLGQSEAVILFAVCAIVGVTQVLIGKRGEVEA